MLKLKHWQKEEKAVKGRGASRPRACNLCGARFQTKSVHRCYCDDCRTNSDLYRFHDWLPEASSDLFEIDESSSPLRAA